MTIDFRTIYDAVTDADTNLEAEHAEWAVVPIAVEVIMANPKMLKSFDDSIVDDIGFNIEERISFCCASAPGYVTAARLQGEMTKIVESARGYVRAWCVDERDEILFQLRILKRQLTEDAANDYATDELRARRVGI